MDRAIAPPEGVTGPPVFTDGFGTRFLGFDAEGGDPVEILAFKPALVAAPDFASTVGVRVARLSGARHTLFARVRRIERPTPDSLLLVSDRVAGWRVAEVLDIANRLRLTLDISAVLNLLRQLVPAVALFVRHQRDLSVGTIAPERLILTPQGRLVLAEYVLGDAIAKLELSRDDLWRMIRVPVVSADGRTDAARSDVLAIGLVALTLLLGRRLREDEFPFALSDLLELVSENHGGAARPLSPGLASWLGRALQLEGHKPLQSPKEAQVAFEELLATERDYVTSPARLEAFIEQFEQRAGPPLEPEMPPEPPPVPVAPEPISVVHHAREPERAPEPEPLRVLEPALELPPPSRVDTSWLPAPPESLWPQPIAAQVEPTLAPVRPYEERSEYVAPSTPEASSVYAPSPSPTYDPPPSLAYEPSPPPPAYEPAPPPAYEPAPAPHVDAAPRPLEPVSPAVTRRDVDTGSATYEPADEGRGWMMKALAILGALVLIEAAAIFWLWNRSSHTLAGDGELTVQSRPASARVTLDDDDLGVTPVTVRLAPGTYTLKVRVGNGEPRVIPVQIRAGVQTAQYLELQAGR